MDHNGIDNRQYDDAAEHRPDQARTEDAGVHHVELQVEHWAEHQERELRRDLWRYLLELNKEGKTIFLTSHYLEEIERLCQTISIIYDGKIVKQGPKKEFVDEPGGLEAAYLRATGAEPDHAAVPAQ